MHHLVALLLLSPLAYAGETEDIVASQDLVVKKHMRDAKQLINEANANTSKHQLRAQEIIKNINLNCEKHEHTNWLDQLNLPTEPQATSVSSHELYIVAGAKL